MKDERQNIVVWHCHPSPMCGCVGCDVNVSRTYVGTITATAASIIINRGERMCDATIINTPTQRASTPVIPPFLQFFLFPTTTPRSKNPSKILHGILLIKVSFLICAF